MERTQDASIAPRAPWSALAERAALVAVLVTPLYFAVFTERIFEAEKAGVVRFLGAMALCALALEALVRRRAAGRSGAEPRTGVGARPALREPLARAALAAWAATLVATLASVAPLASLMGSYDRGQGLLTDTALLALGAAMAAATARPGGFERLATFLGAAVLPAGLYGVVQRAGLDPIPWLGDVVTRVSGPAGASPLFAGHLAMALPFAAWRAAGAWRAAQAAPSRAASVRLAAWLITVSLGAAGMLLSASRGPVLGLAAGMAVAGLALCARRGRWRPAAGIVVLAVGGAMLLVSLNRAPAAFQPLLRLPLVERLSTALDPERNTTRVRMRLWEGTVAALADRPDRLVAGFGPETMGYAWAPYYPPILAYDEPRGWVPDRAHNLWLDTLFSTGLLGAAAMLGLLTALVGATLGQLGLVARPHERWSWRAAWLGGGALAAGAARLLDGGWRLAGPAFGLGLVAGLMAWLAWRAGRGKPWPELPELPEPPETGATGETGESGDRPAAAGFAMAALAAVVAHVVETQVGFPAMATRVALWSLAGGLLGGALAAAAQRRAVERAPMPSAAVDRAESTATAWPDAVLATFVVGATLIFCFARPGLVSGGPLVAVGLAAAGTLGVALMAWPEPSPGGPSSAIGREGSEVMGSPGRAPWTIRRVAGVGAALTAYGALHVAALALLAPDASAAGPAAAATLLLYALALAATLAWPDGSQADLGHRRPWPIARRLAWPALFALALAIPLWLAPAVADALVKEGRMAWEATAATARERGQSGRAEALQGQALDRYALAERLAPWEPVYPLATAYAQDVYAGLLDERLARALADADLATDTDAYQPDLLGGRASALAMARDGRFAAALRAFARAEARSGPWPKPVLARARALRVWGDLTRAQGPRAERLAAARAVYAEAATLAPNWPEVRDEAALTARLAGDPAGALALADQAIAIDRYYSAAWRTAADAQRDAGDAAAAAEALGRYFEDDRNAGDVPALRAWVRDLAAARRDDEALTAARNVVRLAPGDARALADLAALLERSGDLVGAREAAASASALAPGDAGIAALAARLDVEQTGPEGDGAPAP